MPIERTFFVTENYVLTTHVPPISTQEMRTSLEVLAAHPDFKPGMNLVADRRKLTLSDYSEYSVAEIQRQLDQLQRISGGHRIRSAQVLAPEIDDDHYFAKMATMAAELHSGQFEFRLFNNIDDAIAWVTAADRFGDRSG